MNRSAAPDNGLHDRATQMDTNRGGVCALFRLFHSRLFAFIRG